MASPSTSVICSPEFSWMNNDDGQNPCLVASYCISACRGVDAAWPVGPVAPDSWYPPPDGADVTPCSCNSVTYSLLSACARCQGGTVIPWSNWTMHCPPDDAVALNGTFAPDEVPAVDIPGIYSIPVTDQWNSTTALNALIESHTSSSSTTSTTSSTSSSDSSLMPMFTTPPAGDEVGASSSSSPDLTPSTTSTPSPSWQPSSSSFTSSTQSSSQATASPPSQTSESTSTTSVVTIFFPSTSPATSAAPSPSAIGNLHAPPPHRSNAAVIVGGILGSIIGVAILTLLAVLLLRRARRHEEKRLRIVGVEPFASSTTQLYNPEDPSTFPQPDWPTVREYAGAGRLSSFVGHESLARLEPNRPVVPEL